MITKNKHQYAIVKLNKWKAIEWEKKDRNTLDATLFEDLRYNSKEYVSKCRKRLKNYRLIFCILQKLKKHGLHFLQANYEFNPSS